MQRKRLPIWSTSCVRHFLKNVLYVLRTIELFLIFIYYGRKQENIDSDPTG